jgi:hypothetical protein
LRLRGADAEAIVCAGVEAGQMQLKIYKMNEVAIA